MGWQKKGVGREVVLIEKAKGHQKILVQKGGGQAFSQKGIQASWDIPRTKNACLWSLWTPKFWGNYFQLFRSLSIFNISEKK